MTSQRFNGFRILLVLIFVSAQVRSADSPGYDVAAGDELSIDIAVRGSLADLSKLSTGLPLDIVGESIYSHHTITITPDGFLFLPGVTPFKAQGKALSDVEKIIGLALHLPADHHSVSVALLRTNSMAIHIWGEVKQPGRVVLDHPMNLMEALSYAGGPSEHARMKKILLIRPGETTREFNLTSKHLRNTGGNYEGVRPGDTIYVPKKWTLNEFVVVTLLTSISAASAVYIASKAH